MLIPLKVEEGEILNSYTDTLPLTVLYEQRQGKCFALNTGIEHAKGDFIIFTDDGIIPKINWMTAYVDAAKRHPDIGIFAGQVRHEWDAEPPPLAEIPRRYRKVLRRNAHGFKGADSILRSS